MSAAEWNIQRLIAAVTNQFEVKNWGVLCKKEVDVIPSFSIAILI